MKGVHHIWEFHLKDKSFLYSFALSLLMLITAFIISFYANLYALEKASNAVTDIILSNIRVYDVDGIFIYGLWIFWIFVALLGFFRPYRLPFIIKSTALFLLIRSIFIILTHIGPFPIPDILPTTKLASFFTSGGDLFFSAHTGEPFLLALIFWDNKFLRYLFIVTSVSFGIVVLLGHLHYSIDVLGAFFITYTIYHIAEIIFKKDKKIFQNGIEG